jgi:RNA recognition motif-containing protein
MQIVVRELPHDVTESDVRELVSRYGGVRNIRLKKEGSEQRATAVVTMEGERSDGEVIASKLNGILWHGRKLNVMCPLFFGE